ncbi:MAG: gliding motility protein GldC [Bacteroidia bacterium]
MPEEKKGNTTELRFNVQLDEDNVPEKIQWSSTEGGQLSTKECKAFMLSIWDDKENHALRLDLWNKEMRVDEMNIFFFETMMTMAESYERATNNSEMSVEIRKFAREFGEKTELLKQKRDEK